MGKAGKIRISQCMIVKNEEKNIERALSWGKDILWEQIVVDTGSTDRTAELAEKMGAVVYHIPWTDDFAAAKNAAISKAKGEWIAFLDADEVFAPGDVQKLCRLLEEIGDGKADGVSTGWMQMDGNDAVIVAGTQIRIFRNRNGLGYRRRIHEQLCRADGNPLRIVDAPHLSILHYGYRGEAWEHKKGSARNLDLILKELADRPDDHEMLGYLGDEYYVRGEFDRADESYKSAWKNMPGILDEWDQRSAATFLKLMQIADAGGEGEEELLRIYGDASRLLPKEGDFDYILGFHYALAGQFEKGGYYLEQALAKLGQYGCTNKSMTLMGNLAGAYENLALCYLRAGNLPKAVSYSTSLLKSNPYSMSALHTLLKAFKGQVRWEEAVSFLQKLYKFNQTKDRLLVLRTAREAEWYELEQYLESLLTTAEQEQMKHIGRKEHSREA